MNKFYYCLFFIFFFCCRNNNSKTEKYLLVKDTINFGILRFSDTLNTAVKIRNNSDSIIRITNIETACGCTSVIVKDSIIQVGDSIPIQITYVPSYSNDSGEVTKFVTFRTNSFPVFKNLIITGKIIKNEK